MPSPALVIALIALFVALGGSGYAATQVSTGHAAAKKKKVTHSDSAADKKLIKSLAPTLSVASAKKATTATSATTATNATNAANATNATNATNAQNAQNAVNAQNAGNAANATNATNAGNSALLGGAPPSAFAAAHKAAGTNGVVQMTGSASGNTQTLLTLGPFTITATCTKSGANVTLSVDASSSEANSVIYGTKVAAAGTKQNLDTRGPSSSSSFNNNQNYDGEAPSGAAFVLTFADGINSLGSGPDDCWVAMGNTT